LSAGVQIDQAERLRAAAAGGRTAGIRALLAQGVSIDAVDREGDTALMKSIEADDVVAAAVLLQNGASLRLRNHAGVSAEDMALAKDDPALRRALGLDP
jgi:ankyrin repeat protein